MSPENFLSEAILSLKNIPCENSTRRKFPQKIPSQNFDQMSLEGKGARERGIAALQSFWSLKNGTRTFDFRSNARTPDLQGPFVPCDHL